MNKDDYMGAEPNNAKDGIEISKDADEIEKNILNLNKILREITVFQYKFAYTKITEQEQKCKIIEFGSKELIEWIMVAEQNGIYEINEYKNHLGKQLQNLERKKKGGLGSQPPSGDSWATLD
ncbi:hypothetical protein BDAP_001356 [Binucleata daphniae]